MILFKFIAYLSYFCWVIVAFRQFKTEYFYFFFLLALGDSLSLLIYLGTDLIPANVVLPISILLPISIHKTPNQKQLLLVVIFIISSSFLTYKLNESLINILMLGINFLVAISFVIKLVLKLKSNIFSITDVLLVSYMFGAILKYLNILINVSEGLILFGITTLFQSIIGIVFILLKSDSVILVRKLAN